MKELIIKLWPILLIFLIGIILVVWDIVEERRQKTKLNKKIDMTLKILNLRKKLNKIEKHG